MLCIETTTGPGETIRPRLELHGVSTVVVVSAHGPPKRAWAPAEIAWSLPDLRQCTSWTVRLTLDVSPCS